MPIAVGPSRRACLYYWDPPTETFLPCEGEDGKIYVHIESDIEIGAVELKDATTNVRAKVEAFAAKAALYVRTEAGAFPVTVTFPATQPVSIADGSDIAEGATTDAAASSAVAEDATARTGIGLWKGIKNILILLDAKWAALGQAAMAASMPVVIASDQSDVPVAISDPGRAPTVTPATSGGGGENINTTTALAADFYLRAITIHFDAEWTNDVTVTKDSAGGATYDTVLRVLEGAAGVTDMAWILEGDWPFQNGDQIVVTSTNPGIVTFGLEISTEAM